ncbi:MAG: tetratricopeptide repeat protein [Alphaproteobacteria bacterium]|nr:tetratricopeptide repeat protein [Alphaproteobacteria bacterium]
MTNHAPSSRQLAAQAAALAAQAYGQSDFALAESCFAKAALLDPAVSSYRCDLATARLSQGKSDLALKGLESAIDPLDAQDCATMGLVLKTMCAASEAATWLKRALLLKPDHLAARINWSSLLLAEGRHEEAILVLRQGILECPGQWQILNNLGLALQESGRPQEAIAFLDQALKLAPGSREAALNRAHALLSMGRWRDGFAAYEVRLPAALPSPKPRWMGQAMPGETLLVMAEQGFGDAIQFARLLPLAAQKAGKLILACDRAMHSLFAPLCETADESQALPLHDAYCPLLSLPLALGLEAPELFAKVPYLTADEPLALDGDFKVGFVWAGRAGHANDKNRSLSPDLLAPLLALPGISAYSLQIGKGSPPVGMRDLAPAIRQLGDTANAIAGLDLLISADTAPAHLAGALGRPVWTLIPYAPDWRWGHEGEATPWYPTMRLFRQSRPGDWPGVIERVATELEKAARSGNPNPMSSSC